MVGMEPIDLRRPGVGFSLVHGTDEGRRESLAFAWCFRSASDLLVVLPLEVLLSTSISLALAAEPIGRRRPGLGIVMLEVTDEERRESVAFPLPLWSAPDLVLLLPSEVVHTSISLTLAREPMGPR